MILDGAGSFHRLRDEEALLQLLDIERIRIEMLRLQAREFGPQALALALFGIIVEALAVLAAEAALLLHHFDQQFLLLLIDGIGAEIGLGRLHDLEHQIERHFIRQRQRADRHAGHLRGVLDHCRRHAFHQHLEAFRGEAQHATVGEEAARVVDDDRRLADLTNVIQRGGQRHIAGVLADDDFDQHHLLDRREEMDSDEARLILPFLGQRIDRQRRGIGGEDGILAQQRLRLGIGLGLDLAILEHRFDDQIAIADGVVVRRRGDARQQCVAVGVLGAALGDEAVDHRLRMRLALVGAFLIAIDQHHVDAGLGRDVTDAGAHEAGADDGELLDLGRRNILRPARALVQFLHRQEQAADHRRRFLAAQDFCEVTRLDAQGVVDIDQQPFIDAAHDGACSRIVVVGLAAIESVGRREDVHAGCRIDRTARQLESLDVPRRDGLAAVLDPLLRRRDEIGGRHDGADDVGGLGLRERHLVALEQQLQRIRRRHQTRQALRAAATGKQADLDFRQTEPRLRIVGGNAIVTGQRQFERAAERETVDRRDPRLAAGFDGPQRLRQLAALVEQHLIRGFLALALERGSVLVAHALKHREIGTSGERLLAGGDDDALHRRVRRGLRNDLAEFVDGGGIQHVHRLAGNVPRHQRNAVGVGLNLEILICHVPLPTLPSS